MAPVGYANPGPMTMNLKQGQQFAAMHETQHGGALAYGPYPGAVTEGPILPADLNAAAKLLPLNAAFDYIKQFGPAADLKGGRRRRGSRKSRKSRKATRKSRKATRKSRKATRKSRKASRKGRKQYGGVLVRWGGSRKGRKGRGRSRRYRGGALAEMRYPMPVGDEGKMLIPASLQAQAGLNHEWELAKNPTAFAPLKV